MTNKYVCIHGHFYQPPRENAWLEVVEMQDSAAPFHDWNERINFECYAPNTAARILDGEHRIAGILNNYARISFNFGPTLLSWMAEADPDTHAAIVAADRESMARFDGHGSALAQAHSHLILPLANARDKVTQVAWGIADFVHRFGRQPEGMWLAETAADTETLEVLAEQGIAFTILAPRQARAVRKIGTGDWQALGHAAVDPRRPYLCQLPSGRSIALFFYDGGIAQGVAFEGLLNNGKHFAQRFAQAFSHDERPQLAHIATDGESYGHHHKKGEMALADCLASLEASTAVKLTNYGQYLALFPPQYEVQIHENSSWSCVHGVERWRSDCGCNSGGKPHWNQAWRGPLRDTLNWLRDELVPIFEREGKELFQDVWAARNAYIKVMLDRSQPSIKAFLAEHGRHDLDKESRIKALRLLEMQRNALLMFTSCGWFFDEISGLETNQILQYANRAIHYAVQVAEVDLHEEFVRRLALAPSNVHKDGAVSYLEVVAPARVDLVRVGMHYAASSLFEAYPERLALFNYTAESEAFERIHAGIQRLAIGRTVVQSKITLSRKHFSFATIYLGQHNIIGNISTEMSRETFDLVSAQLITAFKAPDLGQVIGLIQQYFGHETYTIWQLFQDEKRKILKRITEKSLQQAEKVFKEIYNDNYQLMTGVAKSEIPIPEAYLSAVQFTVNHDLNEFFANGDFDIRELRRLVNEYRKWGIPITDVQRFQLTASERIFRELKVMEAGNAPLQQVQTLVEVLSLLSALKVTLDLWRSQNLYFSVLADYRAGKWVFANGAWEKTMLELGDLLQVRV